jgi:hypothetical protein
VVWDNSVSEEYAACIFSRLSEDGNICFFGNSMDTRLLGVGAEGHNFVAFCIENEVMKWGGGGWHGSIGCMISHTTLNRNKISCNP